MGGDSLKLRGRCSLRGVGFTTQLDTQFMRASWKQQAQVMSNGRYSARSLLLGQIAAAELARTRPWRGLARRQS